MLDCSGLLVGDTRVAEAWPDKSKGMPAELAELVHCVRISFEVSAHLCWHHMQMYALLHNQVYQYAYGMRRNRKQCV